MIILLFCLVGEDSDLVVVSIRAGEDGLLDRLEKCRGGSRLLSPAHLRIDCLAFSLVLLLHGY